MYPDPTTRLRILKHNHEIIIFFIQNKNSAPDPHEYELIIYEINTSGPDPIKKFLTTNPPAKA